MLCIIEGRNLMNFAHLSHETLRLVCGYLDGFDVLKVWLIGCSLLTRKLFAPQNIEHLECVVYSSDSSTKPLLPTYFRLLDSLQSLSLSTSSNNIVIGVQNLIIRPDGARYSEETHKGPIKRFPTVSDFASLPRSLTSLSSNVFLDYQRFMEAYISDQTLFPNLRTLELGGCVSFWERRIRQVWPSTLTNLTLRIDTFLWRRYKDVVRLNLELETLPTTLERLECFGLEIAPCAFPPSLIALRLQLCKHSVDLLSQIPTSLRSLTLKPQRSTADAICYFSPFPPHLETLCLDFPPKLLDQAFFDAISHSTTLKNLEVVEMPFDSPIFFASLPPTLESFILRNFYDLKDFAPLDLLQCKRLRHMEIAAWEHLSTVPNSHAEMPLSFYPIHAITESPNFLKTMPLQLQQFTYMHTLSLFGMPSDAVLATLPSTLTSVSCISFSIDIPTIRRMPNLKSLTMFNKRNTETQKLDALFAQSLPGALTRLSITFRYKDAPGMLLVSDMEEGATFPSTLMSLSLIGVSGSDSRWLNLLPKGLKELALRWYPDQRQQFWEPLEGGFPSSPSLPPCLVSVSLWMKMSSRMVLLGIMGSMQRLTNLNTLRLPRRESGAEDFDYEGEEEDYDFNDASPIIFEAQDLLLIPRSTRQVYIGVRNNICEKDEHFLPHKCRLQLEKP